MIKANHYQSQRQNYQSRRKNYQHRRQNYQSHQVKQINHNSFYRNQLPLQKYQSLSQQDIQSSIEEFQPTFIIKFFFAYLYFAQGVIITIGTTMPYIYPKLPTYSVMAIFNSISIPFSFKWFSAPFIQKYTSVSYGRRKTWIIISQSLTAICLFISSFYTDFQHSYYMAFFLLASNFFVSLQDIALDSLALKQLKIPHLTTMISSVYQSFGIIFGSMLLLKLTSLEFAKYFSRNQSFTNSSAILKVLSILIFIPSILIHFFFTETTIDQQKKVSQKSLWEVIKQYRIFFIMKSKYFRTLILLIINQQGFNFFIAGYDYQLVKAGFSRDTNNTLQNIIVIPISLLSCCLASKMEIYGLVRGFLTSEFILLALFLYLRIFFPLNLYVIWASNFVNSFCTQWMFMMTVLINNSFPVHALTGMFLTFLASVNNLGRQTGLHTKILDIFGWWTMAYIGLAIQLIIILLMPTVIEWKDEGSQDIDQLLNNHQDKDQLIYHDQDNKANKKQQKLFKRFPPQPK